MADVHQRNPRYVAILAFVASLVLIGGWLLRPRDIPISPPPVPSETELEQLARRAERRSLDDMTKYFAGVAGDVGAALSYVPAAGVSGIVWDKAHIVTGPLSAAATGPVAIKLGGINTTGRPGISGPNLPLTAVNLDPSFSPSSIVRRATSVPQVGAWILALWRTAEAPAFASANFRPSTTSTCRMVPVREIHSSLLLTNAMIGGGLFNMDGGLLGVILPCGDRIAVVDASTVDEILKRSDNIEQRLLSQLGAVFSPLADGEHQYFSDTNGLMVREVWIDSPGDAAGLWPGDVVTALDGQRVAAIDDLRPLASASARVLELQVQRGRRTITLALGPAAPVPAPRSDLGLIVDAASDTYRIDAVRPDSRAARAGIRAGDRLVRINGAQPRTAQQVRRALTSTSSAPLLLELIRGQRRIAVVLP